MALLFAAIPPAEAVASGEPDTALFDPATGRWHIRYRHGHTVSFYYGIPGDTPLMGDWDCDGTDTVAMYRESTGFIYYRNTNDFGVADDDFFFGNPGDIPIAGDWDGDGCDSFGIYRNGKVFLSNVLETAFADLEFYFGVPGDRPFAGDFNGDGVDTVGLYRQSSGYAYLTDAVPPNNGVAPTHNSFFYGAPSDRILVGDWDDDGDDTVGIYRPSDRRFYLSYENELGAADLEIGWGESPWLPATGNLAGSFRGSACNLDPGPTFDLNEGPTDYTLRLRPEGPIRALMLFVDFPDAAATETTNELYDLLVPHAEEWFEDVSYEAMSLAVDPVHAWQRMPRPSTDYGFTDGVTYYELRDYFADAIGMADAATDFSDYEVVYVVSAEAASIPSRAYLGPPGIGVTVDGVEIRFGASLGDTIRFASPDYGALVLIHETTHTFGLPDLYLYGEPDYYQAVGLVGGWDPMSVLIPGGHVNAWHKLKLGWLDLSHVVCITGTSETVVELTPLETSYGHKTVVVKQGASIAYVAEVRRRIGMDAGLCDEGLVVYRVDATIAQGFGPMRVQAAQAGTDPTLIGQCSLLYDAPFDLGPGETPVFDDPSGVRIEIVNVEGDVYTVRVTVS